LESTLNQMRGLLESYGGLMTMMIILTIFITNLVKKPILAKAMEIAERTGYDKSIVTRYVSLIPMAVMFILLLIYNIITVGFDFINWTELLTMSTTYGAISIATYEVAKKQLQAYATKNKSSTVTFDEEKEDLRQTVIALEEMQETYKKQIKDSFSKDEVISLRKAYDDIAKENNKLKEMLNTIYGKKPENTIPVTISKEVTKEAFKNGFEAPIEGDI